jgi:hypothetical protein
LNSPYRLNARKVLQRAQSPELRGLTSLDVRIPTHKLPTNVCLFFLTTLRKTDMSSQIPTVIDEDPPAPSVLSNYLRGTPTVRSDSLVSEM